MKESDIRDYLAAKFFPLTQYIDNKKEFTDSLTDEKQKILTGSVEYDNIYIADLVKLSIIEKLLYAIPLLDNLELLDKEYTLLKTGKPGVQPGVDLMAYNKVNYCLALIELKISGSAEREAITELAAYNQGLQNKYRGLSILEVLWLPISTDWRTTTKSAIAFEMYWQNIMALPLNLNYTVTKNPDAISNLSLKFFNPITEMEEIDCKNIFSYECFDSFEYYLMSDIRDRQAFISYVASLCSRHRIHGFIVFHTPNDKMYPYGFTLCIYNSYKGYLHTRISEEIIKGFGTTQYLEALKESAIIGTDYRDIDFKADDIKDWILQPSDMEGKTKRADAFWDKKFLSVGDFANNAENLNTRYLVEKIKEKINGNGEELTAFGNPDFKVHFENLDESAIDSIIYLGVHQDLISNRITIEHHRNHHKHDFFTTIQSFSYLREMLKHYNSN